MPDSGKKHVALFYGHVASNIGDLAINMGTLEMLANQSSVGRVTVVLLDAAKSDYLDLARHSIANHPNVSFVHFQSHGEKTLRFLFDPRAFLDETETADCDLILLASGEHLFSYAEVDNRKPLFWRMFPGFAARAMGIPCALLPSTLGPFESPEARRAFQEVARCLDGVAVRDSLSAELVAPYVESKRISRLLDPAFMYPLPHREAVHDNQDLGQRIALVMRAERVGIRVDKQQRNSALEQFENESYRSSQAYSFAMALCSEVLDRTTNSLVVFVQTDADRLLAEHIVRDLDAGKRVLMHQPASVEEYVDQLIWVDQVVASRFHAIVLGLRIGKPVSGVYFSEHGHKMRGMFEMLGMPDRCFGLSKGSPAEIAVGIVDQLIEPNQKLPDPVTRKIDQLRRATIDWMTKLTKLKKVASPVWPHEAVSALGVIGQNLASESVRLLWQKKSEAMASSHNREKESLLNQVSDLKTELEREHGYRDGLAEQIRQTMDRVDSLHEMAVESRRNLEAELAELRATRDELEGELKVARMELEKTQCEAVEKEREAEVLGVQVSNLHANLSHSRDRMRRLEDELSSSKALAERRIAGLEKQVRDLQNSARYRLGNMIAQGLQRPRTITGWPRGIVSLYRRRRDRQPEASQPAAVPSGAMESGRKGGRSALVEGYREGGVERVVSELQKSGKSDRRLALRLINVGKDLEVSGFSGAAMELATRALEMDRSIPILRGYFWAAQNAGQVEQACSAIMEIEEQLENVPDVGERKRLQQLQRSAAYQFSMAHYIPERTQRKEAPRDNLVCYVLHNSLPHSSGGYATRTHGLSLGLRQAGYEVHAITRPGYPCDIVTDLDDSDVALHEVIDGVHYHRFLYPRSRQGPVSWYVKESADHLEELFRELRPKVVVAASNHRVGIMSLIAARRLGIPFIYEVRGWWEVTRQSRDPDFVNHPSFQVQKRLETITCNEADLVYTLTNAMRNELIGRGVDGEKIQVLPNSCDTSRFGPRKRESDLAKRLGIPNDVPVIGYVGTFVDYEGLEILAAACGILRQQRHQFRLLLVGNENASGSDRGPISEEILRLAQEHDFLEWLIMPGRVPHEEVESYYSLIDIAPFPRQPWPVCEMVSPMKPLEALAMEKAVVVSSVAALKEMIKDGETGMVFQKGSAESLAECLAILMLNPVLRRQLGRAGRVWVERERDWKDVARVAIDGIQELEP